jgi:hypothetical protein
LSKKCCGHPKTLRPSKKCCGHPKNAASFQKMLQPSKKYNATGNMERPYLIKTLVDQHELIPAGTKMHMGVDGK